MVYTQLGLHVALTGPHEGYFKLRFPSEALPVVVFGNVKNEHFKGSYWNALL